MTCVVHITSVMRLLHLPLTVQLEYFVVSECMFY